MTTLRNLALAGSLHAAALCVPLATALAEPRTVCDVASCKQLDITVKPPLSGGPAGAAGGSANFSSSEIWHYVQDILQVAGLAPNFELISTEQVGNAAAALDGAKRVLYYNPKWVDGIAKTDRWRMYGLLAHEIGHHLQGHTLLKTGSAPPIELEADRYAGFVLAKLGADLPQSTSLWNSISEQASATHPGRADRIAKVTEGWKAGGGKATPLPAQPPAKPVEYVLAASNSRLLTQQDVAGLAPPMLRIARNEIFARHGFTFESEDLRAYFGAKSWYQPRGKNVTLSTVEKRNVEFLQSRETASGGESVSAGFLLPQSSTQALTREQLRGLPTAKLRLARNEIFARNGYIFADRDLAGYFGAKKWYKGTARDVRLNEIEEFNVRLIRSLE